MTDTVCRGGARVAPGVEADLPWGTSRSRDGRAHAGLLMGGDDHDGRQVETRRSARVDTRPGTRDGVEMRVGPGSAKGKDTATSLGPWLNTTDELAPHATERGFAGAMTRRCQRHGIQRGLGTLSLAGEAEWGGRTPLYTLSVYDV